jgi:hypothetical protein
MPEWNPPEGLAGRAYRGFIEVLVDTNGRVQDVRLLQRIAPLYDDALISAAWDWTFEPARLNGRPVLFRHLIEIVMGR